MAQGLPREHIPETKRAGQRNRGRNQHPVLGPSQGQGRSSDRASPAMEAEAMEIHGQAKVQAGKILESQYSI